MGSYFLLSLPTEMHDMRMYGYSTFNAPFIFRQHCISRFLSVFIYIYIYMIGQRSCMFLMVVVSWNSSNLCHSFLISNADTYILAGSIGFPTFVRIADIANIVGVCELLNGWLWLTLIWQDVVKDCSETDGHADSQNVDGVGGRHFLWRDCSKTFHKGILLRCLRFTSESKCWF